MHVHDYRACERALCLQSVNKCARLRHREDDIEALRERCKAALRATDTERLARGQAERRVARLAHEAEALRALPAVAGF